MYDYKDIFDKLTKYGYKCKSFVPADGRTDELLIIAYDELNHIAFALSYDTIHDMLDIGNFCIMSKSLTIGYCYGLFEGEYTYDKISDVIKELSEDIISDCNAEYVNESDRIKQCFSYEEVFSSDYLKDYKEY